MKILLVQTAFLGDVVLATPLIEKLLEMHPGAELWILTTVAGKELLKLDPRLAGVLTFDKRAGEKGLAGLLRKARELAAQSFDIVYSLHKSWRTSILLWLSKIPVRIGFRQAKLSFLYTDRKIRSSASHEVLRNFSLVTPVISIQDAARKLSLTAPDVHVVSDRVRDTISEVSQYIVVFPGSAWRTKRWAPEGYRALVKSLTEKGTSVLLLGAQSEKELCEFVKADSPAVVLAGHVSLQETMYIVKHARAVLCNDSMALHVASAFQIPCVAVFCATSPEFGFGPWQNRHVVVEHHGLSCKPCARHGSQRCPTGTERCMNDIDPRRVLHALDEVTWVN